MYLFICMNEILYCFVIAILCTMKIWYEILILIFLKLLKLPKSVQYLCYILYRVKIFDLHRIRTRLKVVCTSDGGRSAAYWSCWLIIHVRFTTRYLKKKNKLNPSSRLEGVAVKGFGDGWTNTRTDGEGVFIV